MNTTITFRTDETLKERATALFDSMGMNLSMALNLFMRQAVIKQRFPCSLESGMIKDAISTYPAGFFSLFGTGNNLGFDNEPEELLPDTEDIEL